LDPGPGYKFVQFTGSDDTSEKPLRFTLKNIELLRDHLTPPVYDQLKETKESCDPDERLVEEIVSQVDNFSSFIRLTPKQNQVWKITFQAYKNAKHESIDYNAMKVKQADADTITVQQTLRKIKTELEKNQTPRPSPQKRAKSKATKTPEPKNKSAK
jgi:hypothetical protein